MQETTQNYPNFYNGKYNKDKVLFLQSIVETVEKGTGLSLLEFKAKYSQEKQFNIALKYVTATKKTICEALALPVEGCCRYKRKYEKSGELVQSKSKQTCHYTKHKANVLSTNPDEFQKLLQEISNQLKLF